jgi:hypothetical protein
MELHEVKFSDRAHSNWSSIEEIQDLVTDLMKNPPLSPVSITVDNMWSFDSRSERSSRSEIRQVLESLQVSVIEND